MHALIVAHQQSPGFVVVDYSPQSSACCLCCYILCCCCYCCCRQLPRLGPRALATVAAVAQLFPPGFALARSSGLFHRLFITGMDSVDPHKDDDDATSCVIVWLNALQQQQQEQQQQQKKKKKKEKGGSAGEQATGNYDASEQQQQQQQQVQPAELEQSLFGLWALLTAVQSGDGSACYLPSQHAVHGTSYQTHAAQHAADVLRTLRGGAVQGADKPPAAAAAAAAGVSQPRVQRYGVALVNKRRDVVRVLGQWHDAVTAAADSRLSHAAKRQQLQQLLTWLCPNYSQKLLGMHCSVPECAQLWAPLLLACGGSGSSDGDVEEQQQ
jgi:hypothetical protein